MSVHLLDDIRAAAEAKYGATEIDYGAGTVRLLNPLRLPKTRRDELREIQSRMDSDADDVDQEELLRDAVRCVAETPGQASGLLTAVGDDLAVLASVFEAYVGGTQVPEASPSPTS
jgi:hypothetical protein